MLGTNLIFFTLLIAGVGDVLSTDTAPEDERSNNRNEPKSALVIVNEEEILPGSHFEARKREFSIGSFNITIKQNWRSLGLGCVVWPAAVLLSKLLSNDISYSNILGVNVKDNLVVELGTGTGLPSIIAALSGARKTVATDRKDIVEKCTKKNVFGTLNDVPNLSTETLEWDTDGASSFIKSHGIPDLIIGADLIYHESAFKPLADTLFDLSGKYTQIVITGKQRYKELNEKFESKLAGFMFTKLEASDLGNLVEDTRDYVYVLKKKEIRSDL